MHYTYIDWSMSYNEPAATMCKMQDLNVLVVRVTLVDDDKVHKIRAHSAGARHFTMMAL